MSELLEDIRKYWTKRAKGYSEYNQGELSGEQREKWRQAKVSATKSGQRSST